MFSMVQSYVLAEMLRAVRLEGDRAGTIAELPEGAYLTVLGDAPIAGFTLVTCSGVRYALFVDDLHQRAQTVRLTKSAHAGA